MITIQDGMLCINIPHNDPRQYKERILKAIAAAVRWRASYTEDYNGDDVNLTTLAQLQEELTNNDE